MDLSPHLGPHPRPFDCGGSILFIFLIFHSKYIKHSGSALNRIVGRGEGRNLLNLLLIYNSK